MAVHPDFTKAGNVARMNYIHNPLNAPFCSKFATLRGPGMRVQRAALSPDTACVGESPSGKAAVFGAAIRRFESSLPSSRRTKPRRLRKPHTARRTAMRTASILTLLFAVTAVAADGPVERWAKAAGGRESIAAIKSVYREGTLEVAGMQGQIKIWHTADGK